MGLIIIPTCQGFGAYLVARLVKNLPAMWETGFDPWVGKIPWRREQLPIPVFWPGELPGLYGPWGHKESDTTEQLALDSQAPCATLCVPWVMWGRIELTDTNEQ